MSDVLNHFPRLKGVYQENVTLDQPFERVLSGFADDEGTVLLLSGSGLDCSRYHMLAATPWLSVRSRKNQVVFQYLGKKHAVKQDPFSAIQMLLDQYRLEPDDYELPVHAGLFGYFSYDLKDRIEHLPVTCIDTNLPDLCLYAPSIILIQDKLTQKTHLLIPEFEKGPDGQSPQKFVEQTRDLFFEKIKKPAKRGAFALDHNGFTSSFSKPEYIEAVEKIIKYLKAGDIYQANLSQRFEAGFSGDTYALFLDLFQRNPAAFFGYIQARDHTIVSTSPERFIQQKGRYVETRPIKGTIARGITKKQDEENGRLLAQSRKDDAELTMIVDLMRNDLSRVTTHGTVVVSEHKRIEPYENVFHLVSVVQGELEKGKTSVDLLKATFPGGSITGCPKIRSMEIIDELEPIKRHVYTGSIGYISFHDSMDLSIAIRTATITGETVFFSVGGGIVYDSDPEKEYQETLDKGKTLMDALSGKKVRTAKPEIKAWIDGKIIHQDDAKISATSAGFQYGAGVFETICFKNGKIYNLEDHVKRLNTAWENIFNQEAPDITWEQVIRLLIRANGFENQTLAIKLIAAKDAQAGRKNRFLAAFVRKYTHRLDMLGKEGLDIVTYPHPRQSPLADHKTLNYLYYERAGQYAKENGADEALVLNVDRSVSETNTANIFAVEGNTVWVPDSPHVLPGVALKAVLTALEKKGYGIQKQQISIDELYTYSNIILTNSLMGAVRVLTIDKKKIEHSVDICPLINEVLFNEVLLGK